MDDKAKKEALEKLEKMTPEEVIERLTRIGSTQIEPPKESK